MARNYMQRWSKMDRRSSSGVVDPLSYVVQVDYGMFWRRHIEQLRNGPNIAQQTDKDVEVPIGPQPEEREEERTQDIGNAASQAENSNEPCETESTKESVRRYPSRVHNPHIGTSDSELYTRTLNWTFCVVYQFFPVSPLV